jgi:hypothetical protein
MPVVECNCGMVMSVASGGRRTSCIRCGIQLHMLDQANQEERTSQAPQVAAGPSSSLSPAGLNLLLPNLPLLAPDSVHE